MSSSPVRNVTQKSTRVRTESDIYRHIKKLVVDRVVASVMTCVSPGSKYVRVRLVNTSSA